ncbi:helix-turn-helix domain-containing protein [Breoghania sp. L-A4]|uniref:helix-turn-helix domain-containing protein n=1 Tax=Breoghania sp. L-A4 TaxID=2304600 RepID=UPI000E36096F|nr:helix-turn-helix domain-containing protein [Breoghania sp. L-A4]AXS39131.1 transcriptional regulator [Breoghania sp. L-A4]
MTDAFIKTAADLGRLIREARQTRGWTQADLAARCGTGERFIVELENGKPTAQLGKALVAAREVGLKLASHASTPTAASRDPDDALDFLPRFE